VREVRVAVAGVGALGQHHARILSALKGARLVGVHDTNLERAREVAARHGCAAFGSLGEIMGAAEAVVVAVPTDQHHSVARALIAAGKDVLLEKPMTRTLEEADDLVELAQQRNVLLQVGHVERFNPAADALKSPALHARFIEVHRLGLFVPRSLDIDVVLDLMIHDLDLVLLLDPSEAVQVDAVGVPVLTDKVDIANARLRFASGLIANLTASRVSTEKVRKFRVFAPRTYVSVDFQARESRVYRLEDRDGRPDITVDRVGAPGGEPLERQLASFVASVDSRSEPEVSGRAARRVLALAHRILGAMSPGPLAPHVQV
jgi:predicted dehydrogenase